MERAPTRGVRLVGPTSTLQSAVDLIQEFGPVEVRKLEVDEEQQGLLIGRKGATIAQLQESTGCALELRKSAKQVAIAGSPQMVEQARSMILEMLEAQKRVEVIIKVDPEQKGTLLGKAGATINRIQQVSSRCGRC